jgi:murein DD-endopeptidase MepM/ murein hydrolase activator NlpD
MHVFRLLVALFAALVMAAPAWAHGLSDRRDAVEQRLGERRHLVERADQRSDVLADSIADASVRIRGVAARVDAIAAEVAVLARRLAAARDRLAATERRLRAEELRLALLREQLRVAEARLAERIVGIYKEGRPDPFAVVLGATSLSDVVDGIEVSSLVASTDADLVDDVMRARDAVARARARTARLARRQARQARALAAETAERRAAHAALAAEEQRLTELRAGRQAMLADVRVRRAEWVREIDGLEAESERLADRIAAAQAAAEAQASAGGGHPSPPPSDAPSASGFIWPVHGPVVSPFGMRWGRLHAGIDIAVPAGTPIVAAAGGTVIHAGEISGYGLMVIIQHAGNLATAYAHASSLAVSAGQVVAQGQTIAAVGCTGHCFGDHLHFEVRVGGSPVDPMGYL